MTRDWISIERAAELLGVKPRRVFRRLKRGDFETRASAKSGNKKRRRQILVQSLPMQAQLKYFAELTAGLTGVNEKGRPAGSDVIDATDTPSVVSRLLALNEQELAELNRLAEDLDKISRAKNKRTAKEALAAEWGKSVRTVERRLKGSEIHGTAGLLRKARSDKGLRRVMDDQVRARVRLGYLQTYRPSVASVYREIARDYEMSGVKPFSQSVAYREVKLIDPDLTACARMGERTYDDKFCYITLRKKPALPRLWSNADHHQLDHYVIFDNGEIGRPWLTAIQDIATDECLGYRLTREARATYPGSTAIGLTLRHAILRKDDKNWPSFGLFENFYADLGKDFRSQYVRAVCHDLKIKNIYARGYHGKSKPIERWFGVLEGALKKLPGYCGKDPQSNPERQRVGAPRSFEDMRGELMTIAQFEAALHWWIVNDFHHAESRALKGLSPMAELERHIKNGWTAREISNVRALDLLLMRRAKQKVMRFGIAMFGTADVQRAFFAPELLDLINQEVEVFWDTGKIGELIVYKDHRYVCTAVNKELLDFGADEELVKSERELRRRQRKSRYDRLQEIQAEAQYPDPLARAQAEKRLEGIEIEEREKIAVNAAAPAATVLLPKYRAAAKHLTEVKRQKETNESRAGFARRADIVVEKNPYLDDAPLPSQLRKREKNPFLDDDEPLRTLPESFPLGDCAPLEPKEYQFCSRCRKESVVTGDISFCWPCGKNLCTDCFNGHGCKTPG